MILAQSGMGLLLASEGTIDVVSHCRYLVLSTAR